MRKALIDTNIYSAFKNGEHNVVEAFRNLDYIGIDVTVLAELLAGFKYGKKEKENRKELELFLNSERVHILNHNFDTAEYYANIFLNLKKQGSPIPMNDIWIASVAFQNGLELFTYDKHFSKIKGLLIRSDF